MLTLLIIVSCTAMQRTASDTMSEPMIERGEGRWPHQKDSVTRLIRISVERSIDTRVGNLSKVMAMAISQNAIIVTRAATGRRRPCSRVREDGLKRNLLPRNGREERDIRKVKQPAVNMRQSVDTSKDLHFVARTLERAAVKAVHKQRPTPVKYCLE